MSWLSPRLSPRLSFKWICTPSAGLRLSARRLAIFLSRAPNSKRPLPKKTWPKQTGPKRIAFILGTVLACVLMADGLFIRAKAVLADGLLLSAWHQAQASGAPVKPWPWADTAPVARLSLPGNKKTQIILAGTSGEAMAFAPGLMEGGPPIGEPGLSIITAHRDTHFAGLDRLERGDLIKVEDLTGREFTFKVNETRIVQAIASGLSFEAPTPRLALVTCYPLSALRPGPLRYVVLAELTSVN
ncbi:MAG: class GN sortase [Pseudomonadota bacterium]